ncbi:MAG: hypothetical protein IKS71_02125 [Bacteroidales bacterium]|nr:hypothetical protein [Bacteroidales bacterium]
MDKGKFEMTRRWAEITIERWQRRIEALGIGRTGELARSFEAHVTADSKGDPEKITFAFLYYGRFVDMGVGRGRRGQRKPWYSSVFRKEVAKLGFFMASKYGYDAALAISAFDKSATKITRTSN